MSTQFHLLLQQAIQAFQDGNLTWADAMLQRVIKVDAKNLPALHVLGLIKVSQSNFNGAAEYLGRAAKINPNDASIQYNLAKTLSDSGNDKDALVHHRKAVSLAPHNPEAWLNYGKTTSNLGNHEDALLLYGKALALKSNYAEASLNMGAALKELKRYEEAIEFAEHALTVNPNLAEAWSNKGTALKELRRFEEAIYHYEKALSLKPDYAEGWFNKGNALSQLKRFDEANDHYDKALSIRPDYQEALWNKSLSLLLQGNFDNGLPLYESRWSSDGVNEISVKRRFDKPTWLGLEVLKDKTILIYGEQGFGDFIQFCRYVKLVSELGAKVILEVPQPLYDLVEGLEGVTYLVVKDQALPVFDYQCPLLSLPLAFKTNLENIPIPLSYINLNKRQDKILEWNERLGFKSRPRVGIVWSGNPHHKNDHNRSLLLQDILPFLPDKYEYISLQKEVRDIDKLTLDSNPHILNFAGYLNNFLDTAALIENVDLVISVDTSVAHLSGALGKKTFVLLPTVPDWRWLLDRQDSPWYPSLKLYRQTIIGDWDSVLHRLKLDLMVS